MDAGEIVSNSNVISRSTLSTRTRDDILEILDCAKLDSSDMMSVCQSIEFGDTLQTDGMRLLELDQEMLGRLEMGEKLIMRGTRDDSAILCTKNKSYEVKGGQTSNTILVLPDLAYPGQETTSSQEGHALPVSDIQHKQVQSMVKEFVEIRPCKGKIQRIQSLLQDAPYSGRRDEENVGRKYSWEDLLDMVQASEDEIRQALLDIDALQIDGFYQVLTQDYTHQVLTSIINFIEENSWTFSTLKVKETLDTLQELYPRAIVFHCLWSYGDLRPCVDSEEGISEDTECALDVTKICRFFAKDLLMFSDKFNYHEFLTSWQQVVPEGMTTSLSQIRDLCLVDDKSHPPTISYFPAQHLPEMATERFNLLFKKRERWTKEEIEPFIRDLATAKMDVNALLTKHARSSLVRGVKLYNSRRPIT